MAEIEYPGVAKLVSRLVWECRGCIRDRVRRNAAKPCGTCVCGISPSCRKRHKRGFNHINDHRQKNLCFSPPPWYNGRNWISGCSAVGSARDLGSRGRAFESLHSDQNPSEIVDFRGIFLILCLLRRKGWTMVILSFYTVTLFASWYILLQYNLLVFFLKYLLYCIDSTLRK